MIKATEAKAQSAENKIANAIKDVEDQIKKAIKKGKNEVTFLTSYDLIESVTDELTAAGYQVSSVQGGIKIYWG